MGVVPFLAPSFSCMQKATTNLLEQFKQEFSEIQLKILHTNTTLKKPRIAAMFVNGSIGMK